MTKSGTCRLWLRTDKVNKGGTNRAYAGTMPIHIIYSVAGKRQYLNSGVNIYAEQWDDENQNIKGLSQTYAKKYRLRIIDLPTLQQAKEQMQTIKDLQGLILRAEKEFEVNGLPLTSHGIMSKVKAYLKPVNETETAGDLLAFMEDWITKNKGIWKAGSIQVYKAIKQRISDYEQSRNTKLTFENTGYDFFEDYKVFLSGLGYNNVTVTKYLSKTKSFINKAVKRGIAVNTSFKNYKVEGYNDLEVIALTQKEFDKLWEMDLTGNPRLNAIRDVFIFSCVTGMRFSDLEQLRSHQIKADFIAQTVTKTSTKIKIPLNKYSRAILEKYKDMPRPLPIISNQKSNDALHELCEFAEFDDPTEIVREINNETVKTTYPKHELISMHSGRKTFATLSLKKGMSIQNVMKIGGWKDFKSFARYVNVSNEDAQEAMAGAWDN